MKNSDRKTHQFKIRFVFKILVTKTMKMCCFKSSFVLVEGLRSSQQIDCVEPVICNEDEYKSVLLKDTTLRPRLDSNPRPCNQESGNLRTVLMVLHLRAVKTFKRKRVGQVILILDF